MCSLITLCVFTLGHMGIANGEEPPKQVLNVYNWEDYIGPSTLADFEKEFGVKVNLKLFEDEEEMLSEIQSHPELHDVIVASDSMVRDMIAMRLLAEIDMQNIPNIKNIDPKFIDSIYDPGHKYSVPYLWGTTGIVVNKEFIKEEQDSWSVLWDKRYKGKTAMLNNPDEVIGSALKYLGYSLNSIDPLELEEARQKLLAQKPFGMQYKDPIEIRDKLISGELWIAHEYSGEGMFAVDKNESLVYFVPKEGGTIWVDCLCIPRDAKNKHNAELFINFILRPDVSAKISNYLWYANCNSKAEQYINSEILQSPSLYPSKEILDKCEFYKIVGTEEEQRRRQQAINKMWAELQIEDK